jgi:hypothetical protein
MLLAYENAAKGEARKGFTGENGNSAMVIANSEKRVCFERFY